MAKAFFNINLNINQLQKLNQIVKGLQRIGTAAQKNLGQAHAAMNRFNGALDSNRKFMSRAADRVGFMAFQFMFLSSIAERTLGQIGGFFQDTISEGADNFEAMIRGVAQAGIDLSGTTEDSAKAQQFLNDAILDMGTGKTIFSIKEVSQAMREIGKATDLTGTEMEKSNKLVGVTQQVLRLMTIEEVNAEESAKTLIKTMNNFGLSLDEAARVTSVMINVNQSSAITLDELSRSFGFASSQARDFGMDVETTGGLLGILGNRMGQSAGAAGRSFRQLLVGLKQNATKANAALSSMGISLLDNEGNIKPFLQFLKETKTALDEAGTSSDAFKLFLQKQMGLEIQAADALAKLTQATTEEIDAAIAAAKSGDSSAIEKLFGSTPQASIKKFNNAIGGLKTVFLTGLAPAIHEISQAIQGITRDKELQLMLQEIGTIIGQEVVPAVRTGIGYLKDILKYFQKNKGLLKDLVKVFMTFVIALTAMFVIGTLGYILAAFGSTMAKLSLSISAATLNWSKLQKVMIASRVTLLSVLLIVAGLLMAFFGANAAIKTLMKAFSGEELSEAEVQIGLVATAVTGLGVALSYAAFGVPGLVAALATIGVVVVANLVDSWAKASGAYDAFEEKYLQGLERITEETGNMEALSITIQSWFDAAGVATYAMGYHLGVEIRKAIEEGLQDIDFSQWEAFFEAIKNGNILEAFNTGAALLKALVAGFQYFIASLFLPGELIKKQIESEQDEAVKSAKLFGYNLGEGIREGIWNFFTGKNIFSGFIDAVMGLAPVTEEYEDWAKGGMSSPGGGGQPQESPGGDQLVYPWLERTSRALSDKQVELTETLTMAGDIIKPMAEEIVPNYNEALQSTADNQIKMEEATAQLQTSMKEQVDAIATINPTTYDLNTQTKTNIASLSHLTDTENYLSIEVARLVNKIINVQSSSDFAAVALTKLAIEGEEAARRISTLRVSKSGKFSMSSRATSTTFENIPTYQAALKDFASEKIGEKISLAIAEAAIANSQQEPQGVNVGGITINISGNADEQTTQAMVTAINEALSKQLGTTKIGATTVRV